MIPNTTPTPNELFNGEMRKMSDPELRIVMIVTRATFGWVEDKETGMRKEEDWISHSQMVEKSGKSGRAVNYAIQSCIEHKWIEARDAEGNLLDTAEKRMKHGRKIFFRLGEAFLKRGITLVSGARVPPHIVHQTPANKDTKPPHVVRATKETLTKETLTKPSGASAAGQKGKLLNELIEMFEKVNPSWRRLFANKTQRACLGRLLEQHGEEKVRWVIGSLAVSNKNAYAPTATTPLQLEERLGNLIAFWQKQKDRKEKNVDVVKI